MRGPRITIGAAVLASAVRVQAGIESHVWTVIVGDHRLRIIPQKLRLDLGLSCFGLAPFVGLAVEQFKSIRWVQRRATAMNRCWFHCHS